MSHLTSVTVHPSLANRRGRVGLIALWGVQVVLASLFFLAGSSKLTGAPAMVGLFDAIGVGQWLRYATGLVEVASAVALLVPSVAPFGAVALAATMLGAIATHLFIVGGSPALPAFLLAGSLVIAWTRGDQLSRVLSRPH